MVPAPIARSPSSARPRFGAPPESPALARTSARGHRRRARRPRAEDNNDGRVRWCRRRRVRRPRRRRVRARGGRGVGWRRRRGRSGAGRRRRAKARVGRDGDADACRRTATERLSADNHARGEVGHRAAAWAARERITCRKCQVCESWPARGRTRAWQAAPAPPAPGPSSPVHAARAPPHAAVA